MSYKVHVLTDTRPSRVYSLTDAELEHLTAMGDSCPAPLYSAAYAELQRRAELNPDKYT